MQSIDQSRHEKQTQSESIAQNNKKLIRYNQCDCANLRARWRQSKQVSPVLVGTSSLLAAGKLTGHFSFLWNGNTASLGEGVLTNICRDHYIRSAAWECFVWDQSFSSSFQPRPFPPLLWRSPILRFSFKKKMLFALFKRWYCPVLIPNYWGQEKASFKKISKCALPR